MRANIIKIILKVVRNTPMCYEMVHFYSGLGQNRITKTKSQRLQNDFDENACIIYI